MVEENKCDKCGVNHADGDHECPYMSELYGDHTLCNCCEQCCSNCADDI